MNVGRLYWKFFFFIWLAQVVGIIGTAVTFWVERQQDHARWVAATGGQLPTEPPWAAGHPPQPPDEARPPSDGPRPLPPHGGRAHPPHPPHFPLVPLFAAFAASLAAAALLAWYFSKPIRNLRSAFDAAAAGDLDVRVSPSMGRRRDELADLGHDFDRMASRLSDLMDGQRRLLHDVSHELRSPLARLQAAIGLLRQQPARLDDTLQRIERESVRMDHLVGELLTLSRLEAGVTPPMEEEIPVDELLEEIARDAGFEAETSGRNVALQMNGEAIVRGNGELLQRAVENVVRNAIRHTSPGSTVVLEAEPMPATGRVRLAVLDTGPGVPEEQLAAIFEPFFRSGESRDSNGYGLGLALARRVVEAHGGSIEAKNRPEGGLCVEIELPMI